MSNPQGSNIHPQLFIDVVTKQRDDAMNQLANVAALNAHLSGILNERDVRIEELEAELADAKSLEPDIER